MRKPFVVLALASLAAASAIADEVAFNKQTLTTEFIAEGCAIGDFNRDGHADLTAGPFIWLGPEFSTRITFTPPRENDSGPTKTPYDAAQGYSDFFLSYCHDFNADGWDDILVYGLPGEAALVFVNNQGKDGNWEQHVIFDVADGESPDLLDIDGDGKPELLVHSSDPIKPLAAKGKGGGQLGYAEIDWTNPLHKARFRPITPKSPENDENYFRYTHGYGGGDVNGDGRVDILTKDGWFEQPAGGSRSGLWQFHPSTFAPADSRGGCFMYAYDVNADGRNDVVTSYDAHGYGLGWFEQRADGTFAEHRIMGSSPAENPHGICFSQLHAMRLADIDGDGDLDIVTGKRRWAHGPLRDAEPMAPPVLYWFDLVRDGRGNADYRPRLIDDDSGVGTQVTTGDINQDGKPDVAVANKKGVFVFIQQ